MQARHPTSESRKGCSIASTTQRRNRIASAPSITRWSYESDSGNIWRGSQRPSPSAGSGRPELVEGRQTGSVVPRETPVTRSHLLHLVSLAEAGAIVLPASPGFYGVGAAATAQQLIDFVAGKVLDAIGVEHALLSRWQGR